MPINYGLFNLSNNTNVARKRVFPVEAYMKAAGERQEYWNQAFSQDLQTKQAAANMPWLPSDEPQAREVQREFQGRIQGRTAEGNLEDHVYDTIRDAQEFQQKSQAFTQTYAQRQQQEADLRKNAATMQWNEEDIQKNMAASDAMYRASGGVRKDEETGQYRGSYRGLQAVARPDMQKITDEAIKGIHEDAESWETFANGDLVLYTKSGGREYIKAPKVQAAIQAAIALNPAATNWIKYEAQANTLSNPVNMANLSPETRAELQPYLDEGLDPASAQYKMNFNRTLNDMTQAANQYGVNKATFMKTKQGIGNVISMKSLLPDAEEFGSPVIGQGPDMNMTGLDSNQSVMANRSKLTNTAKQQKLEYDNLVNGPNPDANAVTTAKAKLDATNAALGRLNNIEQNITNDTYEQLSAGHGAEAKATMDQLAATKDPAQKEKLLRKMFDLIPAFPSSSLVGRIAARSGTDMSLGFEQSMKTFGAEETEINIRHLMESLVKQKTSSIRPQAVSTTTYQLAGNKASEMASKLYVGEIGAKPLAYDYVDMQNNPMSKPGDNERLEGASHIIYGAGGQRYLLTKWVAKEGDGKEKITPRLVPMNDRTNNIGKITDSKLQEMMYYAPKGSMLYSDIVKTRALINGTDNEVYAQQLAPFQSEFVVDPNTGMPRKDIQVQRYMRNQQSGDPVQTFRLLDAQGRPIRVNGTQERSDPEIETGDAKDLNNMILKLTQPFR